MTFNNIADQVALAFGKPTDKLFKARVIIAAKQEFANLLKQRYQKYTADDSIIQRYAVEVELASIGDSIYNTENNVYRTVNQVYKPLRGRHYTPFLYVGNVGYTKSYIPCVPSAISTNRLLPYSGSSIYYFYRNNHIYINVPESSEVELSEVLIETIFEDMTLLLPFMTKEKVEANTTYNNDMELPYPMDIITTCIDAIKGVFFNVVDTQPVIPNEHSDN